MPWGLYRFHQSRLPHFITFTCYRRQSFLNTPAVCEAFLRILERTRVRYDFFIYGFVVMPNHVHLLISEPQQGTIATVIQSLNRILCVIGRFPSSSLPSASGGTR